MKKNVSLCDACEKVVATKICDVCNKDLCMGCIAGTNNVVVSGKIFGTLSFCNKCKIKFWKIKRTNSKSKVMPANLRGMGTNSFKGSFYVAPNGLINTMEGNEGEGFYDEEFQKKIFMEIKNYVKSKIIVEEL